MNSVDILRGQEDDHSGVDSLKLELGHFILDHADMEQGVVLLNEIGECHQQLAQVEAEIHQIFAPAMEADQRDAVALEGIADTIQEYWHKFVQFLKNVWAKIVQFFELHFTALGRRRLHIKRMMKKVKSLSTNPQKYQELKNQREFKIDEEQFRYFFIGGHFCKNFGQLRQAFDKTQQAVAFVTDAYSKSIIDRGAHVEKAIQSASVENAAEVLDQLRKELAQSSFGNAQAEMLGNVEIKYEADNRSANLGDLKLIFTERTERLVSSDEFTPMAIDELAKIYQVMESMLDQIEVFKNGRYKEIVHHSTTMISSTDKFINVVTSYLKSGKDDASGHSGAGATYREIMSLNRYYLNWMKEPLTDLIKYSTLIFYHVGLEMEKNIQMYTSRAAENIFTALGL